MSTTWIVTADPRIGALVSLARQAGGDITVVAVGDVACSGVEHLIVLETGGAPAEAFAGAVAGVVNPAPGDLVLAADRPAERVLAGAVAARHGLPLLTGVREVRAGEVEIARFGGITIETVSAANPLVLVADGGPATEGEPVAPERTEAPAGYPVRVVGEATAAVTETDLSSAKRIIAAGRGIKAEGDLGLVRDLAAAIGAEVACSRPLAEGLDWLPKSSYIGVSGKTVKPQVYVAVGISGQLQHMVGAQDSQTVVAINSAADAPIFAQADYGVVGDLYEVLPALTQALR